MRWLALLLCLLVAPAWAADGDPCASHFGVSGGGVDTAAELCGTLTPYARTTSSGSTVCTGGLLSASTLNVTTTSGFDSTGGEATICDDTGHCNPFTYTGVTATSFTGVTNLSPGQIPTCTGSYAASSRVYAKDTSSLTDTRLNTLAQAIRNTQQYGGLPGVLTPQMYGAVGDGTTDDTAAFQAVWAALAGTGTTSANVAKTLYIPPGIYKLTAKKVFTYTAAHKGVIVTCAGPHNSVINYTYNAAESDNALFYWSNSSGALQFFDTTVENCQFNGPIDPDSGTNNATLFGFTNNAGGSARFIFRNLFVDKWNEGFHLGGSVQGDTLRLEDSIFFNTTYALTLDNPQSLGHSIIGTGFTTPTAGGDILRVLRGGSVTYTGCLFVPQGTGSIVHYPSTAAATRQPIRFSGGYIELQGTTELVLDDTTNSTTAQVTFEDTNISTVAGAPRNIATLQDGMTLIWRGGVINGSATLTSSSSAASNGPPQLIIENAVWQNFSDPTESYTGSANRPIISLHRNYRDPARTTPVPDRDTGGMTLSSQALLTRPAKIIYLARKDTGTNNYTLPGSGQSFSYVIPPGSNIIRLRLVCLTDNSGSAVTLTVANGNASVTYITQSYTNGQTAFTTTVDTSRLLTEVTGNAQTVVLSATGGSITLSGYVEITYY